MYTLITLSTLGFLTLMVGVFKRNSILLPLTLLGLTLAFVLNCLDIKVDQLYYVSMMGDDMFAVSFTQVMIATTALIALLAHYQFKGDMSNAGEFYTILIFTLIGAQVMVSFNHMVMFFIGIEILSISLYILAGLNKKDKASNEAALKYFLIGSFASGFLLMGIALVYAATHSLYIGDIAEKVRAGSEMSSPILIVGLLLILVGMAFKISAAPFHFWAPDVYEGSPTLVTSFMATVVKTAAIASFLRLFFICFGSIGNEWTNVLTVLAILTMSIGNITALYQKNFKRLLAYSGISHAGFLLIGVIVYANSAGAVLYYSIAYSLASLTAFTILIFLSSKNGDTAITSFNGLGKRNPWLAVAMTIAMLSLAGIPPTAGFFGKYYLFNLAIRDGQWWLVGFGLLNSLISVYYYFWIIICMFVKEPADETKLQSEWSSLLVVTVTAIGILAIGFIPEQIITLIK